MTDPPPIDRTELLAHRDLLLAVLRECPNLMRGSLTQQRVRCGQPGCECARGLGHLKTHLSVHLDGKTRTLYVNREREAEIRGLLAAYEQVWDAINQLTAVNLQLLRGERSRAPRRRTARAAARTRS